MLHRQSNARRAIVAALVLAFSAVHAAGAYAVDADTGPVIAQSASARLTLADYEAELAKLPPASRAEFATSKLRLKQYLDNLYIARALAADARADGLDKDPVLSRQIAMALDRLLANAQVDRIEAAAGAAFDKDAEKYSARAREFYDVNRDRYAVPERIKAAHILVAVGAGNKDAALAKATAARARLVGGENFANVAREMSDDPSVSQNGGELGYFDAKMMDSGFSAGAFALKQPGEISAPVLSKFGYHIILLEDRKPAGTRPFDEVKPELMAEMRTKAKADAKAEATRKIFSDPTLKVDTALIDSLGSDGSAKAAPGKP